MIKIYVPMGSLETVMHQQVECERVETLELGVKGSYAIPESEGGRAKDWQMLVVLHCYQH